MKKNHQLILIVFLALSLVSLTSCANNKKFTVTYMSANTLYKNVTYRNVKKFSLPSEPVIKDYVFLGWYFDRGTWSKQLTEDYYELGNQPLNVTVYARWTERLEEMKFITEERTILLGELLLPKIS